VNAPSYILADRSALKLTSWSERWAACRGGPLEDRCLRTIEREANVGPDRDTALADFCRCARITDDADDRVFCIEQIDRIFAQYAAEEAHDHRCAMFEARNPDKTWEESDELRREWDEIRPVRVPYGMGGRA
jgi:hypothetical protein